MIWTYTHRPDVLTRIKGSVLRAFFVASNVWIKT